jgi:hypothetical protein
MNDQMDSDNQQSMGKKTILTLTMSPEDAKRLQQAFNEGRLTDFGITEIAFEPTLDAEPHEKKWSENKKRGRSGPKRDDAPPRK